jgi:uncharacterized protein (DUF697 family)
VKQNPITTNPVLTNLTVTLIVWLGARYGIKISDDVATYIAGGVFVIGSLIVHRWFATPVADPHDNQGNKLVPETKL